MDYWKRQIPQYKEINGIVSDIMSHPFGYDTELSGPLLLKLSDQQKPMLNVHSLNTSLTGFSLAFPHNRKSYYIPVSHRAGGNLTSVVRKILEAVISTKTEIFVWNAPFEYMVLHKHLGTPMHELPLLHDGQIAQYMLGRKAPGKYPFSLKPQAAKFLNMVLRSFQDVVGQKAGAGFDGLRPDEALEYACDDAIAAVLLGTDAEARLRQAEMYSLYRDVDLPFARCLASMQTAGIGLDIAYLEALQESLTGRCEALADEWSFLLPETNIRSAAQIASLIEEGFWPQSVEKTPTGQWTTGREAMELLSKLPQTTPLARRAAEIRLSFQDSNKLLTTYTQKYIDNASQYEDGRLHPSFNQTRTATGRLSCSYPNAQQLPEEIRRAVIPAPGHLLFSVDYSQIELRMFAHHMGSGPLFDAFAQGLDPHAHLAKELGVDRSVAKTLNFAMAYGGHARRLSRTLGCEVHEAETLLHKFHSRVPQFREVRAQVLQAGYSRGFVRNLLGRRRYFPEAGHYRFERNQSLEAKLRCWSMERQMVNHPFQSGAADIIKIATVRLFEKTRGFTGPVRLIAQIHDENLFEIKEDALGLTEDIVETMRDAYELKVPLEVSSGTGKNWADAK